MPRAAGLALVVLMVTALEPPRVEANIYNVQSILATEAEEGLGGSIIASVDWRTGNVSYLFLSATPVARYRHGDHQLIGIVRAEHKTSRGQRIISRFFEHLRYRYELGDRLLLETFGQHEFDAVKRLQLRALVGAGPKVDLVEGDDYGLGLGLAYMLEYERIKNDDEPDAGDRDLAHRASSYLTGRYELAPHLQLIETFYVQPRLTALADTRLLSDTQLVVQATAHVSLTTSFSIAYDTEPPAAIDRLDTALVSSITIEL